MKAEQLLRTEFYRTLYAGFKTESVNPHTPRIRRRSFLRRLRVLRMILRRFATPDTLNAFVELERERME
jgi:hypothetical protein